MSKASKVINIFIFLFAVVVVVFGVLLFQKREDITQARTDTAATLEKVSRQINDSKNMVSSANLMIEKTSAEVKTELDKLERSVTTIVEQRDTIAANYTEVANIVLQDAYNDGKPPYTVKDGAIKDYKTTDDTLNDIKANAENLMKYFSDRDERIATFISNENRKLGRSSLDGESLRSNDRLKETFDEIETETGEKVKRMTTFRDHVKAVHGLVAMMDSGANMDEIPEDYDSAVREILSRSAEIPDLDSATEYGNHLFNELKALNKKVSEHKSLREQNDLLSKISAKAQDEIASYAEKTKEAEERAFNAETALAEAQKEILRYQSIIDPTGFDNEQENAARTVDYAALKDLVGKVVYVNQDLGFITINIGSESEVVRSTGEHILTPVPAGATLTVATSLDPADAKFVCKVQVHQIRSRASTATILASAGGSFNYPKVGNVVYFSKQDIETVKAANEEAMRKKAEERAAAEREQALLELNDILTGTDEIDDDSGIDLEDEDYLNEDDGFGDDDGDEEDDFADFEEE